MNIKPEQIPDEVVEAAAKVLFEDQCIDLWGSPMAEEEREDWKQCARKILSAALPVLLGEPVGWKCTARPSSEGTQAIQFTHNPESADTFACLGWTVTPVYTLPTQDTPNADQ